VKRRAPAVRGQGASRLRAPEAPAGPRSAALRLTGALLAAALTLQAACSAVAPPQVDPKDEGTPLDRYVAAPDPAYAWEPVGELNGDGCVAHVLKMTSQTWRTSDDVDRTLWWHWLTIVEPEKVTSDTALLYIHGGVNNDKPPGEIRPIYARIARQFATD